MVVRNLIPRDVVAATRKRVFEVVTKDHTKWPAGRFHVIDPDKYRWPDGSVIPGGLQRPGQEEEVFRVFCEHPNLKSAMKQILGGDVQLFTDQIAVKYAMIKEDQKGMSFYHQDSYYWHIDPCLGCNCWIPMDTVGKDAIALGIMPGSQKDWKLHEHEEYYDDPAYCGGVGGEKFKRLRVPLDQVDFSKEVVIDMEPGDGLFFTNYTWHRSEKNLTGEDRLFYAIAYQLTPEAAKAVVGKQAAHR